MPFAVPGLTEAIEIARRAFRTNLKGSDAWLWPNNIAVSAKVIGGATKPIYDFIDFVARQRFVHTAEAEWLDRHGLDLSLARLTATYAEGDVTLTGIPGTSVPSGLGVTRTDGRRYTSTTGGIISVGSTLAVHVRAVEPGKAGNAPAGAGIVLDVPLSGIASDAVVAATGIGTGADLESDESYRARLLFRKRNPPRGGAVHDYVDWVRSINGVTRVTIDPVTAGNGRTSVGVYFLMDDTYANGIPQPADVAAVAAFLNAVRPAGAIVQVAAPVADTTAITIAGLSPDTTAVRDAVIIELQDLFRREVEVSTLAAPYTLYRSLIIEAIANATGEHHHTLSVPASDIVVAAGHIPVLGTVTFA